MTVKAICYELTGQIMKSTFHEIKTDTEKDLLALYKRDRSLVFVISKTDLKSVVQHTNIVQNRHEKHESRGLAVIFEKVTKKIAAVDTEYSANGRVVQGIESFLKRINGASPCVYFIAVPEEIFNDTLKIVMADLKVKKVKWKGKIEDDLSIPGSLMRLMGPENLPEDLIDEYCGNSIHVEFVRRMIYRCKDNDTPVLVVGDTGTGKEIVAKQIHNYSDRGRFNGPFQAVNCAAIPTDLLESELFGHKKGAFTGAVKDKDGIWKLSDQGTLFLDEIGEISLHHQAKILRALQEGKIRPVGGESEIVVNTRIIAATNRNIAALVRQGRFREDLYYRLRQILIPTPSLKSHLEDISVLVNKFWKELCGTRKGPLLSDELIDRMKQYTWPGNVRELKSVLNSLHCQFIDIKVIGVEHLQAIFQLYGQPIEQSNFQSARYSTIECWTYMNRLMDSIHATQYVIEKIIDTIKHNTIMGDSCENIDSTLAESFTLRLDELRMYCDTPGLFAELKDVFIVINELKARLMLFADILFKSPHLVPVDWESGIKDLFHDILTTLNQSLDHSMKELASPINAIKP